MAEQAESRNGASAVEDPVAAPAVRPTGTRRFRLGLRTTINLLALVAELAAFACVVVLLVRIGLAYAAANPQNVIVRWIDGLADVVVLVFRDLFVPADARVRLAVNNGVAAVFWLIVGLVAARVLRGLARLVGGRDS